MSAVAFDGGGTASNPYLINSVSDLKQLAKDVNNGEPYYGKYFKVTSDIDLAGEEWTPIGLYSSNQNICMFMGIFDGDGHTISNLYINNPSKDGQGLFGVAFAANFRNLNLVNVRVTGNNFVGGLVGFYGGSGGTQFIENCNVSGKISGSGYGGIGGIVGAIYVTGSSAILTIKNSCFNGTVSSNGDHCVGGIVGITQVYNGGKITITNCIASGTVSGSNEIGGIVGHIYAESGGKTYVKNSIALNRYVNGGSNVGRIVGSIFVNKYDIGIVELNNNYGWKGMKNDITGNLFTDNIGLNEINGEDLVLTSETPTAKPTQSPMAIAGLLIGLCTAVMLRRK